MYRDIVEIVAPSQAASGDTVIVDVRMQNVSGTDQYLAVTAVYDSTSIPFQVDYLLVSPGQTVVFRGWFIMPSKNVRVTAWGWSWDGSEWVLEDQMAKDIALATLSPQLSEFRIADFYKV